MFGCGGCLRVVVGGCLRVADGGARLYFRLRQCCRFSGSCQLINPATYSQRFSLNIFWQINIWLPYITITDKKRIVTST